MATDPASPDSSGPWLSGVCPHCLGEIEFPAEMAGSGVDCPHCGAPLDLVASVDADSVPGRAATPSPSGLRPADLASALSGHVPRRAPGWSYRFRLLLVGVAVLALPLIYLGLVAAIVGFGAFCGGRVLRAWHDVATHSGGGKLGVFVQVGGVLFSGFLLPFLLKPLFARGPEARSTLALNPAAEPLVTAFVGLVCDAVGAKPPLRIEVDCRPNASAGFRGGWRGWLSGHRVVTLGLPLVATLDARQLAGVLAHEFGHFRQGLAFRASYLVRAVNAWFARAARGRDEWDVVLDRWEAEAARSVSLGFVRVARSGVVVSRGVMKVLWYLSHAVSCALLRVMELDADRLQIEVAGSTSFVETFRTLQVLPAVAREQYRRLRACWDERRPLPENWPVTLADAAASLSTEERARLLGRRAARDREVFDTHPPDEVRLGQAERAAAPGLVRLELPATALFSDFGTLSRQVTRLHYLEDLRLPVDRIEG